MRVTLEDCSAAMCADGLEGSESREVSVVGQKGGDGFSGGQSDLQSRWSQ